MFVHCGVVGVVVVCYRSIDVVVFDATYVVLDAIVDWRSLWLCLDRLVV